MKYALSFLVNLLIITHLASNAQNLVKNPSFEKLDSCVSKNNPPNTHHGFEHVKFWEGFLWPLEGVILSQCTDFKDYTIPRNFYGYQYPRTGTNYAGANFLNIDGHDYLKGALKKPLRSNRNYHVSFFLSRGFGRIIIHNIGVYFKQPGFRADTFTQDGFGSNITPTDTLPVIPQVQNPEGRFIKDTTNWVPVQGFFSPDSPTRTFYIGNFSVPEASDTIHTMYINPRFYGNATYLIDDVSVTPLPGLTINQDTLYLCPGDTALLTAFASDSLHYWQNGQTRDTLRVNQSGTYWAKINNRDTTLKDTIVVSQLNDYQTNRNDKPLCSQGFARYTIEPATSKAVNILWSDGDTTAHKTFQQPGTYWYQLAHDQCRVSDTFTVKHRSIGLTLPKDTIFCRSQSPHLTLPNRYEYDWGKDGLKGANITFRDSGTYPVTMANNHCQKQDSLHVQMQSRPEGFSWTDTTLCEHEQLQVSAPNKTIQLIKEGTSPADQVQFAESGYHELTLANSCGTANHRFRIKKEKCACNVYFPNAFSPNRDGLNEQFKPKYDCKLDNFQLTIYNRWGQAIFTTNNPESGWQPQSSAIPSSRYFWEATYEGMHEGHKRIFNRSGTIRILK